MKRQPVCWAPEEVRQIINPDAEAVPDDVFMAVHSDVHLIVQDPPPSVGQVVTPHQFLDRFMRSGNADVRAVVLGQSGSGKSHLIQWMRLNIRPSSDTCILTIPKAGTSLRSIISKVIDLLPEGEQKRFREQLERIGGESVTNEGQMDRLLDQIAFAISQDRPREGTPESPKEFEEFFIEYLPHLFRDPYFRKNHFFQADSIVAELVAHVFAKPGNYRPAEDRRRFVASDLRVTGLDFQKAAGPTRDLLDELPRRMDHVLQIINRNLDRAIRLSLSFTEDDLVDLMTRLRIYLHSRKQRLILLIEDLARLQGIDSALLQALTIPSGQADEKLCELRWAAAVTTGYYENTMETVQTRVDMRVDLGISSNDEQIIDQLRLARFAARYLNAVRVGTNGLQEWDWKEQPTPPNACDECRDRTICRESFGEMDGVGLYPFTEKALWIFARRTDNEIAKHFNPRNFLKRVLINVLDKHADTLKRGEFPPLSLLAEFGGRKGFGPATEQQIRTDDRPNADRRITLLELWDGSGQISDLADGIHNAFRLPPLKIAKHKPREKEPPQPPEPVHPQAEDPKILAIREWRDGGVLPESLVEIFREKIFAAIYQFIDWDSFGLASGLLAGATGVTPFRQRSIQFVRPATKVAPGAVVLNIPNDPDDEDEFLRVAIALEGLIRWERDWNFADGEICLTNFLECLESWANDVKQQLSQLTAETKDWNPGEAAFELLVVGALLSGRVKDSNRIDSLINACFEVWPEQYGVFGGQLMDIYERLRQQQSRMIEIVRTHHARTKGGQAGTFIEPTALIAAVGRLREQGWTLSQQPPTSEHRIQEYQSLNKLYGEIAKKLNSALRAEQQINEKWWQKVTANIGESEKIQVVFDEIGQTIQAIIVESIPCRSRGELKQLLEDLSGRISDVRPAVHTLVSESDPSAVLPHIAKLDVKARHGLEAFVEKVGLFLSEAQAEIVIRGKAYESQGAKDLETQKKRIRDALAAMDDALNELESWK